MNKIFTILITIIGLSLSSSQSFAEANYVYHEATTNNPGCGPNYRSVLTPNSTQPLTIAWKIEYQNFTNQTRVYYTTNGSTPTGAFGTPGANTFVVVGSYSCTFGGGPVVDVATATIPAQPAGTVVKYIISAWHSGGLDEIFANGCGNCGGSETNNSSLATVFSYTVTCSGTPSAGTATASPTGFNCAGTSTISLSGNSSDPSITYQWQSSTDNSSFSNISGATSSSYTTPAINITMYYRVIVTCSTSGLTATSNAAKVTVRFVWNGSIGTAWNDPGNWCNGSVPLAVDNAIIPSVANNPVLTADAAITDLEIASGATLSLNDKTFTVGGIASGDGPFKGSASGGTSSSNLTINGSGGTLYFDQTSAATRSLNNLSLNNGTTTLGSALDILGALTESSATFNLANLNLTLKSNSTNTARIGDLTGSTLSNATNVTVERYIPNDGRRAYRLLSPGVTTSTNIRTHWQENTNNTTYGTNDDPNAGYGIQITGSGGSANGFDQTAANPASLYRHRPFVTGVTTSGWVPFTNTSVNTLKADSGYLVYIYGDRNTDLTNAATPIYTRPTSATTLRATGTIKTGTQTFTGLAESGRFSLVANPFASPIKWSTIYTNNSANFENFYTYWDAKLGTSGAYVTVTNAGVTNVLGGAGGTPNATIDIQSGQSFFVKTTTTGPSLVIREVDKSTVSNRDVFRTQGNIEKFGVNLYFPENAGRRLADGVVAMFNSAYSAAVNGDDAEEISNFEENIAISRDTKHLSIEARPIIQTTDTLQLYMSNMKQLTYQFEFNTLDFNQPGMIAELVDKYTSTRSLINLSGGSTQVSFTVSADAASAASDRFYVDFRQATVLPVTVTNVKAYTKNQGVQVEWTVETERDADHYEVERSNEGRQFNFMASVQAVGNIGASVNYNSFDATPNAGDNYYRIVSVDRSGVRKYSKVVRVNLSKGRGEFSIYPNPITGNTLTVQLKDLPKGNYALSLVNNLGQQVFTKMINHAGGSVSETIELMNNLASGIYQLTLKGEGIEMTERIIK